MFKNFKLISMAVSFVLLFQLNAFALSDEPSEKQPNVESISEKEIPPELICATVPPPTPTAITTSTPSSTEDYAAIFKEAYSLTECIAVQWDMEISVSHAIKFIPSKDGFYDFHFMNYSSADCIIVDSSGIKLEYIEPVLDDVNLCYHVFLSKDKTYYAVFKNGSFNSSNILIVIPNNGDSDLIEDATEIKGSNSIKDLLIKGALHKAGDTDYFYFTTKESGACKIKFLKFDNFEGSILDINGYPVPVVNNYYYNLKENSKYYIKIWDKNGPYSLYEFSMDFIKDDYGDTFSNPCIVTSEKETYGSICSYNDVDVFSFTATKKSYHINANHLASDKITLYNKSYELLEKSNSSDSSASLYNSTLKQDIINVESDIIYDNLTIGDTYYLKVGNTNPVEYLIALCPFTDDYGNTYDSAQIIKANTLIKGKSDYSASTFRDIEVFKFIPETSGTYSIENSLPIINLEKYSKTLADYIKLEKFDDNSKATLLSPSIDDSFSLNYDLVKGEDYFLTLQFPQNDDYSFTVNGPLSSPTPSPTLSPTPTPGLKKGDINDDGNINAVDFAYFRMYLLGKLEMPSDTFFKYRADLNRDEEINSIDFAILQKYLLGIIEYL